MSITDPNSVLILGAGVSHPFGIPLGGELIDTIAAELKRENDSLFNAGDPYSTRTKVIEAVRYNASFKRYMIHAAVASQYVDGQAFDTDGFNKDLAKLRQLRELLTNQTSETIDDFIVENPTYSALAKIGIAAAVFSRCFDIDDRVFKPKPFEGRLSGPQRTRNWIHLLINIIRHGIRNGEVTEANKVQIITFNYDTLLEYVLERQFENTESRMGHFSRYVEINHVHGGFDLLEAGGSEPARTVLSWANKIHVVNQADMSDEVNVARTRAQDQIRRAANIYAVGFSFAGPNCRRIGLDKIGDPRLPDGPVSRRIHFCNYDGNAGLKSAVEKFELHGISAQVTINEAAGTVDRPLGVVDWIKSGHLGELPG